MRGGMGPTGRRVVLAFFPDVVKGRSPHPSARLIPRLASLLLCCLLASSCGGEPPASRQQSFPQAGLRFNAAPGWTVSEKSEDGCTFAVEASKGPDLRLLICLSPPRQDILFTQNTFVSCENVKQYIQERLKGLRPACRGGGSGDLFGYDALYVRLLRSEGKVRVQFVNHVFYPVKGRLMQVMAMTVADDDQAAKALYEEHAQAFTSMMGSVRLR